jgi:hypothetical protein
MHIHRLVVAAVATMVFAVSPAASRGSPRSSRSTARHRCWAFAGVPVPPVKRTETSSLVDLARSKTDGYEHIVINLAGQMLSTDDAGGTVGVVLIPDISPFDKAFYRLRFAAASLETSLSVSSRTNAYFMAPQQKFDVGISSRTAALAYNNTRSSVEHLLLRVPDEVISGASPVGPKSNILAPCSSLTLGAHITRRGIP